MMWRSKDHRSAGLWRSLPLIGGSLGGHGRLFKSFQPLIVAFVSADDAADHSLVLIWVAMGDFLVFSALISSSPSSAVAGTAAADRFMIEFVVDCWIVRRGPLGSVEDQLPLFLLVLGQCYRRSFSLEYFPCLMANEEDQFFIVIIQLWKYPPSVPRAPCQERREKWLFQGSHFPSSF
uniref:Uncharacterized protein n=1 Tax=Fagus sylvatica TaxID=28930 RepID=A0A2N9JBB8_FAGSY